MTNGCEVCRAVTEAEVETGLETVVEAEVDDDARGRRWRMPITGGTMRSEHGSEMGCYAIVAMVITCLVQVGPRPPYKAGFVTSKWKLWRRKYRERARQYGGRNERRGCGVHPDLLECPPGVGRDSGEKRERGGF